MSDWITTYNYQQEEKCDTDTSVSFSFQTCLWQCQKLNKLNNQVKELCFLQIHKFFTLQWTLLMQYGCLKLIHFSEKWGRLSSTGSKILTLGSHCSAICQPVLDWFIPRFNLKYDDFKKIKTDGVNTVVFNLHQIKQLKVFLEHPIQFTKNIYILPTVQEWKICKDLYW